ncbi:hypothetical protein QEN19_000469 [Hanseniaspora menglaensis]
MALIFPNLTALQRFAFRPTALASGLPIFLAILNSSLIKFESPLETKLISILKSLSTWNFKVGSFAWLKLILIFLLACNYERRKGTIRFGVILNLISVFSGLPYIILGTVFNLNMSVQGLVYWINILWIALPFNDIYKLNEFTEFKEIFVIKIVGVLFISLISIHEFNLLIFLTSSGLGTLYYFKPEILDQKLNLKSELFLKIELLKYWTNSEQPYSNTNLYSLLKLIKIDYLTEKEMQQKESVGHQLEIQNDITTHRLIYEGDEGSFVGDEEFEVKNKHSQAKPETTKSNLKDLESADSLEDDTFALPPIVFQEEGNPRSRRGTLIKGSSNSNTPKLSRKNTIIDDTDASKLKNIPLKEIRSRSGTIGKND